MTNSPMRPAMVLRSGGWFDFCNPSASRFDLNDIVCGLSRLCRFGGHTMTFYSVAEHSLNVAKLCNTDEEKKYALLHDASEAFLGDMISPLKQLCPDFKALEEMAQRHIYRQYGLDPDAVPPAVRNADLVMLHTEISHLTNDCQWNPSAWCESNGIPKLRYTFDCFHSTAVATRFERALDVYF